MPQLVTYAETRLVKRHRGTMPVILTCPHDGSETPPKVRERTAAETPSDCRLRTGRDSHTAEITEKVAQTILTSTGLSPYVVIARFQRRYIDANRKRSCAYVDPDAKPFYDEYHDRIASYVAQILLQNGERGFLFDVHGTPVLDEDPADIYLGTVNGDTLNGLDRDLLFHRHGLRGLLAAARHETGFGLGTPYRHRVSPARAADTETGAVNGGFTVRNYGDTLPCIQIENAATVRDDGGKRDFLIEDLAFAIVNFTRRHAPF